MAVAGRIFVALDSLSADVDGVHFVVHKGDTVREGHPILEGRDNFFEVRKNEAKYEYEAPKVPVKGK